MGLFPDGIVGVGKLEVVVEEEEEGVQQFDSRFQQQQH